MKLQPLTDEDELRDHAAKATASTTIAQSTEGFATSQSTSGYVDPIDHFHSNPSGTFATTSDTYVDKLKSDNTTVPYTILLVMMVILAFFAARDVFALLSFGSDIFYSPVAVTILIVRTVIMLASLGVIFRSPISRKIIILFSAIGIIVEFGLAFGTSSGSVTISFYIHLAFYIVTIILLMLSRIKRLF